ncbi:BspA family leucine-rich repeat surface protein [Marinigracilibium pacificum]|uniref:DUF285 domain-containing protein n=1 Tax=Marinigracilibium pacificum TaxID=2729599 RepID=A0A848IZW6_9BACT|nr:BspA family leucine-rich repeat surface protein [Marinigracilibium pacificum]NMM47840.1 DUF285 domain-containing protein [Marinigracilibium pacificum]
MKKIYFLLSLLIAGLTSCEKEETITTYTLTTQINGSGSVSVQQMNVMAGDTIVITATPDQGKYFNGWTGDTTSYENPVSIVMNSDKNLTANFVDETEIIQLADNGVTLYCLPIAETGKKYPYNGEMYEIVDSARLYYLAYYGHDVTKVITTNITNMNSLFKDRNFFNQDISTWDVSNVTDMELMFYRATYFNKDISNWDVSKVTNMGSMFHWAQNFNQDISKWDVSNVTDMSVMFGRAEAFNQNISGWNVSKVTDMFTMFGYAVKFNQNLSSWDVDQVSLCLLFATYTPSWTLPKPRLSCTQ